MNIKKYGGIYLLGILVIISGCNVVDTAPTLRKVPFSLSLVTAKGIVNADDRRITISRGDAEKGCSGKINGFDTLKTVDSLLIHFNEKYYTRTVDSSGAFKLDFVKDFIEGDNVIMFYPYTAKGLESTPSQRSASLFITN